MGVGKRHQRETAPEQSPPSPTPKPKHNYLDLLIQKHEQALRDRHAGIDYQAVLAAAGRRWPFVEFVKQLAAPLGRKGGLLVILDEAHLIAPEALTDIRLLISSALDDAPPLKVVLAGQEPLRQTLRQSLHADLLNRISVRFPDAAYVRPLLALGKDYLMSKYFPRELLYRLRNKIPLQRVIADHLNWPCKRREGRFCFVCPRCGESLTAVNPRTNLGRCFRCEENFNAIDFVMLATGRDFVEAVHFLADLLPASSSATPAAPTD